MVLEKVVVSTLAVALASMSSAAIAQDEGDSSPGEQDAGSEAAESTSIFDNEIVVRAQKREQNVQDVGVSVTAYSGEQMDKLGFSSAAEVASLAPNIEIRRHFISRGLTTNLFVRGVGQTNFNNATEGSVAGFVDDFYLASASTLDFLLFDMERAEVLRGPQGTLFGRNATGGAFQYFTAKPELGEFSGRIKAGIGNFDRRLADGHLNIPLGQSAALRVSAHLDKHDHMVENVFPGKPGSIDGDFQALRGQLRFEPTSNVEIILKAETGKSQGNLVGDNGRAYDLLDTLEGQGDVIEVPVDAFGFAAADLPATPNRFSANGVNVASNEIDHLLGRVTLDIDNFKITSITGYLDQDYSIGEDCDGSPTPFCNYNPEFKSQSFSQELRIQGETDDLVWSVGGYYLDYDATADTIVPVLVGLLGPNPPGRLNALSLLINFEQELVSKAAFAQLEYSISDQITLIGGLRLNNDRKDFEQLLRLATIQYLSDDPNFDTIEEMRNFIVTGDAEPPNEFTREVVGDLTRLNETNIGATAQINWTPNDDSLIYASYRRGIKGGGFNNEVMPVGLPANEIPYKDEILTAYELGGKFSLDSIFRTINGAIFYYDYTDYQAVSFQNFGNFQENKDARLFGAEIEATGTIGNLDFILGGSYLDTKVYDIVRPGGFMLDTEMGEAPKFSANWLFRYTHPVAELDGDLVLQTDGRYVGSRFADVLNQSGLKLDSYTIINALLSYENNSGDWGVEFWVKNLFDKRVETFKLEIDNLAGTLNGQVNWNQRRTFGANVTYRF
jgi:outer membrane receptor protein involved in Fe transport